MLPDATSPDGFGTRAREPHRASGASPGPRPQPPDGGRPKRPSHPFEYAILRVVPRVERGERFNAGIVVHSRSARYLGVRVDLDEGRLAALAPDQDPTAVRDALEGLRRIGAGEPSCGPIARLSAPQRFHWLVAPASTIVQPSEVHTGITDDPAAELDHLFEALVAPPVPSSSRQGDESPSLAGRGSPSPRR